MKRVSFRGRLTLSYTILTALLLTVALCALAALLVERAIRSTMSAVDEAAARTQLIVDTHRDETDDQIAALVEAEVRPADLRITFVHRRPDRPAPRDFGEPQPPPPPRGQDDPPPRQPDDQFGFAPRPGERPNAPVIPLRLSVASLVGLRPRAVFLHAGAIVIAPDGALNVLVPYAVLLGAAEILTVLASWAIGRSITQQALRPLATVTSELRRFAAGDFAPSVLETADRSELGDLVAAYNGAAAQVVAAFSERERTEEHLRLFLGEAGHEMRTPLTVISAYLDLLDASAGSASRMSPQTLQSARGQMQRLRNLVERVMALARMEGTDRSSADLIDVVEVAQEAIASVEAVQGGTIRLHHEADDVVVRAEPWQLQEAIGNLVENAVVYGGGTPVDVAITIEGDQIVVRVHDGGPGISSDDRERLFQHFFRGEASTGKRGSGLGLAIVARAAVRLGGQVILEDAGHPGGATFRLTIPIYQPEANGEKTVRVG